MTTKKRVLGRGLDALLGAKIIESNSSTELQTLSIDKLQKGQYQPRNQFSSESLEELAQSIKTQGIIQPIVVRKLDDFYEIIAGERRWLAAKMAGLQKVPVIVKMIDDNQAMAIALIENIQREDLNCLEQALALNKLASQYQMTHQQLADLIGKSRATVTNLLRLLELCDFVKELLNKKQLEMGHARTLISLSEEKQCAIARKIIESNLTVREAENLVKTKENEQSKNSKKTVTNSKTVFCSVLNTDLIIKNDVQKEQGQIVIAF